MSKDPSDVFSTLFRWAHRDRESPASDPSGGTANVARGHGQGENFTTAAFAFLLRELWQQDRVLARSVLSWICLRDGEQPSMFAGNLVTIETQRRFDKVIPDIYIEAPGVVVFVEVKKDSGFGDNQISTYLDKLKEHVDKPLMRLVLLTVFQADYPPDDLVLKKRWSEVADFLEEKRNASSNPVAVWLVEQFLCFLRRQSMTFERVNSQYIEGVGALRNLKFMLGMALDDPTVTVGRGAKGGHGFYTKDRLCWVGIYLEWPERVTFQFEDTPKLDLQKMKMQQDWSYGPYTWSTHLDLTLAELIESDLVNGKLL